MSRPAYSAQLLAVVGDGAEHDFVPPPGYIAVVRDIDIWNTTGGVPVEVTIPPCILFENADLTYSWRGRQVVPAGGRLGVVAPVGSYVLVSGYVLTA